jgi:HlyD family secretion protein
VIHQLTAHTIGRDIRAGDVIMEIVPDMDVDRGKAAAQGHRPVYAGQKAFLRFSTFDQRITPQLAERFLLKRRCGISIAVASDKVDVSR